MLSIVSNATPSRIAIRSRAHYMAGMKAEPPPLRVAKPCPKDWNAMTGDDKRRFCEHCNLHVHNLSGMSAKERERLIASTGGRVCITYELHPDGTMLTPKRWSWLLRPLQRIRWSVAAVLATIFPFLFSACAPRRTMGMPPPPSSPTPARLTGAISHESKQSPQTKESEPPVERYLGKHVAPQPTQPKQ